MNGRREPGSSICDIYGNCVYVDFEIALCNPLTPAPQTLRGKLSMIDLAGSERVGKTGASAER